MREQNVEIPYKPRPLQQAIHDTCDLYRFVVACCHRRLGKTVTAVNHLQRGALTCQLHQPRFALVEPTYKQGKGVAWDYMKYYAGPIPGVSFNEQELRVDYPGGGRVRIYGADDIDSLRGIYVDGVWCDEYQMIPPTLFDKVLRPALSDRKGWAVFTGTPAGRNEFYKRAEYARLSGDPEWTYIQYKASETGYVDAAELESARKSMTEDSYLQEYECSFEASIKGAIYAKELSDCRDSGRITGVPVEPSLPVDTTWDLGIGDSTAIWFTQTTRGGEVRIVDYFEDSGETLPYYADKLQKLGYRYGEHWAPPDIQVREWTGDGTSRLETAKKFGINFQMVPDIGKEDGIHAARMLLPKCIFDDKRTYAGREALQNYKRDYNPKLDELKATPVKDWSNHGADAFRYLAVRHKVKSEKRKPVALKQIHGAGGWMV